MVSIMGTPTIAELHASGAATFRAQARAPERDDDSDDNPDDSYHSNHTHYSPILAVSCLFRGYARSWQCGGQGFESP